MRKTSVYPKKNPLHHLLLSSFLTAILICLTVTNVSGEALPKVRVVSVRRVFHNGEHNAFTDMCRFQGRYYLAFRSCPDGHSVFSTASIIVLSSSDTKTWEQVYRFSVEKRDTRDPHFLVFNNKLFVYTGTWYCGGTSPSPEERDLNRHLGYAVRTENGRDWQGPEMLEGTYGHYIWRAATYGGKAYLCGRRKNEFVENPPQDEYRKIIESAMLESNDGLIWKKAALFQEENGDETAFLFEPDGSIVAVGRRGGNNAELCMSKPPYSTWQRTDLGRYIGGPLLATWQGRYLVGGRKHAGDNSVTSLCWLVNGTLHEFAELPSDGDNLYPGFIELSKTKALVSYYSSHEKDSQGNIITAIYLAELEIE